MVLNPAAIFNYENFKRLKKENPVLKWSGISKLNREKWKIMTQEDKAPYFQKY